MPPMPPLHRDHIVHGPFTLKGGKLTFRTASGLLGYDARVAMAAGRNLTVTVKEPEGTKKIEGKVLTVELLEHVKPMQWEIIMRIST